MLVIRNRQDITIPSKVNNLTGMFFGCINQDPKRVTLLGDKSLLYKMFKDCSKSYDNYSSETKDNENNARVTNLF